MIQGVSAAAGAHVAATRLTARGTFLCRGRDKVYLRAVTYGPCTPTPDGTPFPTPTQAASDLAAMAAMGVNALRTFTAPPRWLLDLALEQHLLVLVGLPWTQHVCFGDDAAVVAAVHRDVRAAVAGCAGHAAVGMYVVGNEIPPDIVRWLGPARVEAFIGRLAATVRAADPGVLVTYANFPPTEYLDPPGLDLLAFNVYLHRQADFRRYLLRLQNLAGDRPLLLTEFGIDAIREGAAQQAETLAWQVRAAFELGVAGTTIFAWTDDWYTGGAPVTDWAFGLVDRARVEKPAHAAVRQAYLAQLPPLPQPVPRISVVVCAYQAERTLQACLVGLTALRYPDVELLLVDDGSTDGTAAIAAQCPSVRVLTQENRGLSAARNAGVEAASGAIVAFTDADCVVDPDWLTYLAHAFASGFVAVGGPNLPPPEDERTAACVAAAPGGPAHVLLDDAVAEHVPGCNMAFRRDVLRALGGFDPIFRAAGDDVDVCWRLQDAGHRIGFSPAALVWHFRRNTVAAYLRQQMGYGAAEALLSVKHPGRFNELGQSRWFGRIYGDLQYALLQRRPVIYFGRYGRALFQTLYEAPGSLLAVLPFTLEWNALGLVFLVGAAACGGPLVLAVLPLSVSAAAALASAWRARLEPRHDRPSSRLLVALLTWIGPLARSWRRQRTHLMKLRRREPTAWPAPRQAARWDAQRGAWMIAFWSECGVEKEALLQGMIDVLRPRGYPVVVDQGWREWDLEIHRGVWARVRVLAAAEEHGGGRRLLRLRYAPRPSVIGTVVVASTLAAAPLLALLGATRGAALVAVVGAVALVQAVRSMTSLRRVVQQAAEAVAERCGLGDAATAPEGS